MSDQNNHAASAEEELQDYSKAESFFLFFFLNKLLAECEMLDTGCNSPLWATQHYFGKAKCRL